MGILQNDTKRVAQIVLFDLIDINAVVADLALRHIIKPIDQIRDGCLSCSGGTDKSDLLTRCRVQIHIVQYDLIRIIAKVNVIEHHIAGQFHIIHAAIRLMDVLPCPQTASLLTLNQLSILFFRIDHLQ